MDDSTTTTRVRRCRYCGAEYVPLVIHSVSGPGFGARVPRHQREDTEDGGDCPGGGRRLP